MDKYFNCWLCKYSTPLVSETYKINKIKSVMFEISQSKKRGEPCLPSMKF